jgi:hypothetical protein
MYPGMPGVCSRAGFVGGALTRIAIIGGSLEAIACGHRILDAVKHVELHLFEESAEMGLMGEAPGIFTSWPVVPEHWVLGLGKQTPEEGSTAVRRSWFEKAMSASLSARGCTIHLRTRITNRGEGEITFVGAGPLGSDTIQYDALETFGEPHIATKWEGGVCHSLEPEADGHIGQRADGTVEVWWEDKPPINPTWVQRMQWVGDDPKRSLADSISRGIETADALVDTIIQ